MIGVKLTSFEEYVREASLIATNSRTFGRSLDAGDLAVQRPASAGVNSCYTVSVRRPRKLHSGDELNHQLMDWSAHRPRSCRHFVMRRKPLPRNDVIVAGVLMALGYCDEDGWFDPKYATRQRL